MFRVVNREFQSWVHPLRQISRFNSEYSRPLEMNQVQLSGTIEHEIRRLRNDALSFYLKTRNVDHGFCIHKISIPNKDLLDKLGRTLRVNQGIHIGGRLKTQGTKMTNKWVYNSEVIGHELFFLDENLKPSESALPSLSDQNRVKLLGFVRSHVQHSFDCSTFCIGTHYRTMKVDGGEEVEYHNVRISRDDPLRENIKNLRTNDRVYLEGPLDYNTDISSEGIELTSAHISPTFFIRLRRLRQQNNHFVQNQNDKNVNDEQ